MDVGVSIPYSSPKWRVFSLLGLIRGTSAAPVRRSYGNVRRFKPAGRMNSCSHLVLANRGVKQTLNDAKRHSATKSRIAKTDQRETHQPHRKKGKSSDGLWRTVFELIRGSALSKQSYWPDVKLSPVWQRDLRLIRSHLAISVFFLYLLCDSNSNLTRMKYNHADLHPSSSFSACGGCTWRQVRPCEESKSGKPRTSDESSLRTCEKELLETSPAGNLIRFQGKLYTFPILKLLYKYLGMES